MIKKIIQQVEYTLENKDIKIVRNCLDYCYHRLKKHKCGISGMVNLTELNKLREELK